MSLIVLAGNKDKVEARGGNLNSDGTLVHGACYSVMLINAYQQNLI